MSEKIFNAYRQEITLTSEQEACLKYSGERTLMVKGLAGAGKSLVLMEFARKLLSKYGKDSQNKVAIFTYQNTLVSTTKEYLEVNGTSNDGVLVSTINSHIKEIYELLVECKAAPFRKYPYSGNDGKKQRINNVKAAQKAHLLKYGKHRFQNLDPEFWIEEFDWMKEMNVWTDDMDMYLHIPRKGRGGKVRMSQAERITAYQLFLCYCDHLEKTNQGDWADQTLFIIRHPELIPEKMKYEHVLIDEAQDLSLAQMTAIMMLYNKDMIVAMDMNQRIFGKQWTAKQLGIETTTKKLTKSMRTTKQIDALAESVRSKNDGLLSEDDRSQRAIPERDGDIPELVHLDSQAAERKYVINEIKSYLKQNNKVTIGIICSKNDNIDIISEWLASDGIAHEQVKKDATFSIVKPGVKVASAYGSKGLEFDIVIIPMFAEGNYPYGYQPEDEESYEQYMIKMRNLVYVSMTRARFKLLITFWGNKGSRFIADMDPQLYKLIGDKPRIVIPKFIPKVSSGPAPEPTGNKLTGSNSNNPSIDVTKPVKPAGTTPKTTNSSGDDLLGYLKSKGIEAIDKREKGGSLWIVGGKDLDSVIQETKKLYGARWTYSEKGGNATKHRSGWFTKSTK